MRILLTIAIGCMLVSLLPAGPASAADVAPGNTNLKVEIGNPYIKNVDRNVPLSPKGKNTVLRGKRIHIPIVVENAGKETSEPVRLTYTEKPAVKGSEPRLYRVPALDPGKKYTLVLTARFDEPGVKEFAASLSTVEGKPLRDEKRRPRPGASSAQRVTLEMKE